MAGLRRHSLKWEKLARGTYKAKGPRAKGFQLVEAIGTPTWHDGIAAIAEAGAPKQPREPGAPARPRPRSGLPGGPGSHFSPKKALEQAGITGTVEHRGGRHYELNFTIDGVCYTAEGASGVAVWYQAMRIWQHHKAAR